MIARVKLGWFVIVDEEGLQAGELKLSWIVFNYLLVMKEENSAKRQSESMALLQKLIRIDSKDCNFHFRDELQGVYFKVAYQQTNIDNHSNDALLRQFWHHIYAHYFKKIEFEEMRRIEYANSFIREHTAHHLLQKKGFERSQAGVFSFGNQLDCIFTPEFLNELGKQGRGDRGLQVWLKTIFMAVKSQEKSAQLSKEQRKKVKVLYSKLKQNRGNRQHPKKLKQYLQEVNEMIASLDEEEEDHLSPIDKEIQQLQQQEAQLQEQLADSLENLTQKIQMENQQNQSRTYSRNIIYGLGYHKRDSLKDLECLEYLIRRLEEKQIAESVAKVVGTERANGQFLFKIDYQKGMNVEPRLIPEKELIHMNYLRETSLINFYRTGVKSLYSFVCHNYVGFRELMQNRNNVTSKLKDKDLLQMMKKGACLANLTDIQHEMTKFSMCHHCKFLYLDNLLFTCKFSSDKQAIPKINTEASCDPNLSEVFQEGPHRNRTSQRFLTRKKNCLTSYAKISSFRSYLDDQYVCGRKYCLSCIKDSYSHENVKENGLCPFCLGVCTCTRCLRNEKIAKFKSMYSMLGGDLIILNQKSHLEQLQGRNDEVLPRGRGRPKKYMVSHITINATQKKLRKFDEKENFSLNLTLGKKGKRNKQLYNHWKKNDSGETQQSCQIRRKVKRGVGRPRLDRKKSGQTG